MSALHERDFILRLIKQLVEVIARALKAGKAGQSDEAQALLEAGCLSLLGMDFRSLAMVDAASAAGVLGDATRVLVLARLVAAMGEVASTAGEQAHAASHRVHALELALEARARKPDLADASALIGELLASVPPAALGPRHRALLDG